MKAPKQLRKPSNWQDFETLCKKLWGEIWQCPEIKKNGRQGQSQHGVDVYGIPKGESMYYGIQCKGKDDYTNSKLTIIEINEEITKAYQFKPVIKKLYFTTTACKDAVIEQEVRQINIDHIAQGRFEVHLYSWEDIVDLIEENRNTYQWYVNSQNFKDQYDVKLYFENGEDSYTCEVPFDEIITDHVYKEAPNTSTGVYSLSESLSDAIMRRFTNPLLSSIKIGTCMYNASIAEFNLNVQNTGNVPIKNCKVIMNVDGDFTAMDIYIPNRMFVVSKIRINTHVSEDCKTITYSPQKDTLVPEDVISTDCIRISPKYQDRVSDVTINWRLLSDSFQKEGVLKLKIKPVYTTTRNVRYVDKPELEKSTTEYKIHEEEGSII